MGLVGLKALEPWLQVLHAAAVGLPSSAASVNVLEGRRS